MVAFRIAIREHKGRLRARLLRLAQDAGAPGPARGLLKAGEAVIDVALGPS